MTIQEAIRTGKPFFRRVWTGEGEYQDRYDAFEGNDKKELYAITIADILADDWEVESNA